MILLVAAGPALEALAASSSGRAETAQLVTTGAEQALACIDEQAANVVLVDFESLGEEAYELIRAARSRWPDLPLIAVARAAGSDEWIRALESGASDVIAPGARAELAFAVDKALVRARRATHLPSSQLLGTLVLGRSPAMLAVADLLARVAPTAASVLATGRG